MSLRRVAAAAVVLAMVTVACGQFNNVHERAIGVAGAPGGGGAPVSAGVPAGTVPGAEPGTALPGAATQPGAQPGQPGTAAQPGTQPGTTQPGQQPATSGGGTQARGNTTGTTGNSITIAIHAPLTGAAPLKASSFDVGKDMYWEKGNNGKPVEIFGRRVKVVFQDDQYNPSHARLVCQQMATESKGAFLLVGGGGTDQIQACAQYAGGRGIPYLSAGVTEIGMRSLKNYFALSMSYAQQAPLIGQYVKNVLKVTDPNRMAAVVTNTANFDDFVSALTKALPGIKVFRSDKNERGSQRASSLCTGTVKNYDVVVIPNAPAYYLELASAAKCKPQYVGPGITNGLDQVADLGCKSDQSTLNARFFSPAPAFQDSDKYDAGFRKAAAAAGVSNPDDIMFLLWGLSKGLHQIMQAVGPKLTREGFISIAERGQFKTGVFPDLTYTPQDHFGARQVHVLKNVCQQRGNQDGYYITEAAFKSSF